VEPKATQPQPSSTPTEVLPVTADGQPQLLWKEETLLRALDIGHNTLWQRISEGAYPPPQKLPDGKGAAGRSNRWDVRLLLRWMDSGMPHYGTWEGRKS
jgi:hypothetical protein